MIIGTAGHIDHGKSALVEALTGRRMDPLAEEQRRGITMDLHFAPLALADGGIVGVVDVPGHEDLVRTMVAGAAGLDVVLLIVAADEGIMPQTREHLAVVEQLRVPAGIPVLTKSDLVEPEWLAMVEREIVDWLRASPVRFATPIATSARTGAGVAALREALSALATALPHRRSATDLARLPIDRAFSMPGAGTVVTGTAWSGALALGDAVRLLPADLEGRIRSLERHGGEVTVSRPGDRIAVGIAGVDRDHACRGQVLVRQGDPWELTRVLDVSLHLLPAASHPILHLHRVRMHLGTMEALARVHRKAPLLPGQTGTARLVLEEPTVARGADRFVLRSYSPVAVIGGGRILDPFPPPGKALWPDGIESELPSLRLSALLARRPHGIALSQLPLLLGVTPDEVKPLIDRLRLVRAGAVLVSPDLVSEVERLVTARVQAWQQACPAESGIPMETLRQGVSRYGPASVAALDRLLHGGSLVSEGGTLRESGFRPSASGGDAMIARLIERIEAAALTPPTVAELETEMKLRAVGDALRLASRNGQVIAIERDRYFGRRALAGFVDTLRILGATGPITPAVIREATGLSRKFIIPLLEWADGAGLTVRQGDARVAGPRLAGWA